jgi:hypothetical protein
MREVLSFPFAAVILIVFGVIVGFMVCAALSGALP